MRLAFLLLLGATPPWEAPRVPAGSPPPAGLAGMKAADCGGCHTEIYAEWQRSTHARAWTDRQFQKELAKDPEVGWVCLNCHTPAGDQQAELALGTGAVRSPTRSQNPSFDAVWREEGLSCATCHVRDGAVLGPYGDTSAPHAVRLEPGLLDSSVCLSCHQAVTRYEGSLVCSFNTGTEWSEAGSPGSCQSCHMPAVTRALVPEGVARPGRQHFFPGSGIPKDASQSSGYGDAFAPGGEMDLRLPDQAAAGARVEGVLTLRNARAGHLLPTGDPERYLLATVEILDAAGRLIGRTLYRVGQRWSWWPEAQKLADNRLSPGEEREVPFSFPMPTGGARVRARLEHFRISPENAAFHDLGDYPISALVAEKTWTIATAPR